MIIQYDKNPSLTTDQKLDSLINTIQLALNEIVDSQHEIDKKISELKAAVDAARP